MATLLGWLGVDSPKVSLTLFDRTFPVAASPAVTATAVPGSPASSVTRLSVSVPSGYGGDKVEFIRYPSDGGPGQVIATATVTGRSATATWTHTASATGTAIRALIYGPLYGAAGFPYATPGTLAVPGGSLTGMTWTSAQLPLPANAMNIANTAADVFLGGVACPTTGNCIAVGNYTDSNQNSQALIETLSHDKWTPAQAPLPANAAAQQPGASLGGIACPAARECIATGDYDDQSGNLQGMIETFSHGAWTTAQAPTLGGEDVFLDTVTCAEVGTCVATGTYTDSQQVNHAVLVTLSHGTWSAVAAPLPPRSTGNSQLNAVSCPAPGTCVAIGGFNIHYSPQAQGQGLIEILSQGTWTPSAAPLPADASSQNLELSGLACPAPGTCIAVGAYDVTRAASGIRALIETLANGKWTPTGAPGQPGVTYLNDVACPYVGACVATGTYNNSPQGTIGATQPWTETLSQGAWIPDTSLRIPGPGGLGPVVCPVTGGCVATVIYNHPFVATIETSQPRS